MDKFSLAERPIFRPTGYDKKGNFVLNTVQINSLIPVTEKLSKEEIDELYQEFLYTLMQDASISDVIREVIKELLEKGEVEVDDDIFEFIHENYKKFAEERLSKK